MPSVRQYLFGPGSLEMIRLNLWSSKVEPQLEGRDLKVKCSLAGQYDIYCGTGNMHRIDIKIEDSVWSTEVDKYTNDFLAARSGDPDAAERVATSLIDWEIEDWSDPCEDGGTE